MTDGLNKKTVKSSENAKIMHNYRQLFKKRLTYLCIFYIIKKLCKSNSCTNWR